MLITARASSYEQKTHSRFRIQTSHEDDVNLQHAVSRV